MKLSDKSIKMLAASASSAFCTLFCVLSAQPSVIVGVHLLEDGGVKDLSVLKDFTFMDLYMYLIESKDKEFDHKSLRTFKSLAYLYFKDVLVRNVWISPIQGQSKSIQKSN